MNINPINQSMIESQLKVEKQPHSRNLEKYKKKLLIQVIGIFIICLVIILERVFYQVIVESEEDVLASLQLDTDLTTQITDAKEQIKVVPQEITQNFLRFYGHLSQYHVQFLIITHLLATFYVGFDSLLASKLVYVSMAIIYFTSLLQLFYGGGRPFWEDNRVLASTCLSSYNHPSLGLVMMIILPTYTYYCWMNRGNRFVYKTIPIKHLVFAILLFVLIGTIQFINYLIGTMFIINIAVSLVFVLLIMTILATVNTSIDTAIKKSTLIKVDAKKYVFYWLLLICVLQTLMLITYSGQDLFLDIEWVQNYMSCTNYLGYDEKIYQYDEIVGPWFNFVQSSCVFAWVGAVFGISACYRKMDNFQWSGGSNFQRLRRILVTNTFIIPSWLFVFLLQNNGNWIEDIGLNEFIVDSIHFFILYIWIFGYMPIFVLHKLLKSTHKETDDQYFILIDNSIKNEKKQNTD